MSVDKEIRCIFCGLNSEKGEAHKLTDEHIIPQVLGGFFTIDTVCAKCNSDLGGKIVSILKENIYIVTAITKLGIQPPDLSYKNAKVNMYFNHGGRIKGYFNNKGKPEFGRQEIEDGSIITPEKDGKEILKILIDKCNKKSGQPVNSNIDKFDNLPYDLTIPISGTDISIIKRKNQKPKIEISGLDQPIPFRIPAIIAFEHLAYLSYPYVLRKEFDPIRAWILNDNVENRFILLHTILRDIEPDNINYLPYHYVRIGYQSGCLSAIVGLFGVIKFLVFFAELGNVEYYPHKDIAKYYYVYDLKKKKMISYEPPIEVKEKDSALMNSVSIWGMLKLHN